MRFKSWKSWAGWSAMLVSAGVMIFASWFAWHAFPAISGYGAKYLCSAVYLQQRQAGKTVKEDLADFPFSLGKFSHHVEDSSVTGSVWGFATRKAIYRSGCGCTLVNNIPETEIRGQSFSRPAAPDINPDTVPWPMGDLLDDTIPPGIDLPGLQELLRNSLQEKYEGKASHTRALLVIYRGQLVAEEYAPGYNRHTLMLGWSVSKSLMSALTGILVKQGKLDPKAPAPVPEWMHTPRQAITLEQLLQQTSGIGFKENYEFPSEVTHMLFSEGNMASYVSKLPLSHPPGSYFNYSSGNSNILSRILRNTAGDSVYATWPYDSLFYKIGMYSLLLEPDASGTFVGSSYSYATARDFARFGLLYLNKGKWNGEQILPESWIDFTVKPSEADPLKHYGYQFWLNGKDPGNPSQRWYPDVPSDMFFADGYGGQDIYIIPSRQLVVVRLGLHKINENMLLKKILETIR